MLHNRCLGDLATPARQHVLKRPALLQLTDPKLSRRSHMPPELFAQLAAPVYFVDFLREPVVDDETGETLDAHPSFYEAAAGGLKDIR